MPRGWPQMRRHLLDQVAPRLVHPVEQTDVAVEAEVLQAGAHSAASSSTRPIASDWAVFFGHSARDLERRADAADEIHAGVEAVGQRDRHLARPHIALLGHGSLARVAGAMGGRALRRLPAPVKCGIKRQANAPVAQLDRVLPSEGRGHRFESCRVRHLRTRLRTPRRAPHVAIACASTSFRPTCWCSPSGISSYLAPCQKLAFPACKVRQPAQRRARVVAMMMRLRSIWSEPTIDPLSSELHASVLVRYRVRRARKRTDP